MKKLMTAIFALSAMTAFANTDSRDTVNTTVNVSAKVESRGALVIKDSNGNTLTDDGISLPHGTFGGVDVNGVLVATTLRHTVEREDEAPLLFHTNQTKVAFDLAETLTLKLNGTDTSNTLTSSLKVNTGASTASEATSHAFTITSTLTQGAITSAVAGDYSGSTPLTITIQ